MHFFQPFVEIFAAHASLLLGHHFEGVGGIVETVIPLYSTAMRYDPCGRENIVIYQGLKEFFAVYDTGHIDAIDVTIPSPYEQRVGMLRRNGFDPPHIFATAFYRISISNPGLIQFYSAINRALFSSFSAQFITAS